EQEINDIAAVFVDGTNFALFPDDSILHFDIGSNEFNFFNNTGGALGIEYDGISEPNVIVGLLNTGLSTHTVKIAVSDTNDTVVDTGLFLSAFGLGEAFASATSGNDILAGTTGNDSVDAGDGNDSVFGATGLDTLNGGNGDDRLHGCTGNDMINGGTDNDILDGASGNDRLNGGTGDDEITGGTGNDIMSGGTGIDNFTFASTSDGEANPGDNADIIGGGFHNIISDFTSGTDKISLTDSNFNLSSLSAGSNFFTIAV
ncbi:MAG: choice-of-anchor L domain-containing protein, partial [Alphaproteobacteria bacterium]